VAASFIFQRAKLLQAQVFVTFHAMASCGHRRPVKRTATLVADPRKNIKKVQPRVVCVRDRGGTAEPHHGRLPRSEAQVERTGGLAALSQ
jgi:hypothetical protein